MSSETDDGSFLLTSGQINDVIRGARSKISRLLKDTQILVENGGEPSHCVGLYLYAVEEFGKLLLLKDALTTASLDGKFRVDKTIFGKRGIRSRRVQAHHTKISRALQTLPPKCGTRINSVIVKHIPRNTIVINSGNPIAPDVGNVSVGLGATGAFRDTQAPLLPFSAVEKMNAFYVDWDNESQRCMSDEIFYNGEIIQVGVLPSELLPAIQEFRELITSI